MKQRIRVAIVVVLSGIGNATFAQSTQPDSSNLSAKDTRARALVVKIEAKWKPDSSRQTGASAEVGAGFIIAVSRDAIFVATARHVVTQQEDGPGKSTLLYVADSVLVTLSEGTPRRFARVVNIDRALLAAGRLPQTAAANDKGALWRIIDGRDTSRVALSDYDLAVVRIARDTRAANAWQPPSLDRLGDVLAMRRGDDVMAIGCPDGLCWRVPAIGDAFIDIAGARRRTTEFRGDKLTFESQTIALGNSGGPLFNDDREVIGMVIRSGPPLGYALPINDVVKVLGQSGVPINLRRPTFPRDGYHLMVEVAWLTPLKPASVADSLVTETRLPSARLTISRRARSPLTWHVGALRLAPYNTSIHAAMGGLGFTQQIWRLSLKPFVELGFGQSKSRYDAGGYYRLPSGVTALPSPSSSLYTPLWVAERASSAGFGGGVHAEIMMAPHVSVVANIARWSFGLTPKAPTLPSVFFGGGLRWSR